MNTSPFNLDPKASATEVPLSDLVQNILIVLNDKERYIIENRFALGIAKKLTLEKIGQRFGVTRERVRQIERTALRKLERNAQNTNLRLVTEFSKALLKKEGGIMPDTAFKSLILKHLPNIAEEGLHDLHLALSLDPEISFFSNTLKWNPFWNTLQFSEKNVEQIGALASKVLSKRKQVIPLEEMATELSGSLGIRLEPQVLSYVFQVIKDFKLTPQGIGLYSWRHIHPRTLRDKISFVLSREKRPLHFSKITTLIRESGFDEKRINVQAVHNELIRHEGFILVGRGIYALKEWGYESGTVADLIIKTLSDGVPRTREEITKLILDQRYVKTITIYLNLRNKPDFVRVGRDQYTLRRFVKAE